MGTPNIIKLLEDYLMISSNIENAKKGSMVHKVAVKALAQIDENIDIQLNIIADTAVIEGQEY